MIKIVVATALLAGLAACSSEPPPPPPLTPTQAYLKDVHAAVDGKALVDESKMVEAGRLACSLIPEPGVSHSRIVAAAAGGLAGKGIDDTYGVAEAIVSAAEHNLCPTVHYATTDRTAT